MNIAELSKFRGGVSVDTISELTSASGVTIDGMLIKDGQTANSNIANDGSADSPRGWASAGDANYTFTSTGPMRVRVASPSTARTVTLPTTNIKAGAEFELLVTGATETNYVVLNSSGANEVDRIGGSGKILVVALQDTPTTAAHWQVVDVWEKAAGTITLNSGAGSGANYGSAKTVAYLRNNKAMMLKMTVAFYVTTGTGATDTIGSAADIPTRFRPATETRVFSPGIEGGVFISSQTMTQINTSGVINLVKPSSWISSTANVGVAFLNCGYEL
jgi:hypothetical protein